MVDTLTIGFVGDLWYNEKYLLYFVVTNMLIRVQGQARIFQMFVSSWQYKIPEVSYISNRTFLAVRKTP